MARGATAIKSEHDGSPEEQQQQQQQRAGKRRCVQSACVPCRKRKSKCDGGTPVCATCTAVYKTECHYDEAPDSRRGKTPTTAASRRDKDRPSAPALSAAPPAAPPTPAEPPASSSDNAEFLLRSIRSLPESEAHELVEHIRRDAALDIGSLADSWRRAVTLPPAGAGDAQGPSLEGDLAVLLGKPAVARTGQSRHYGHTSGLGLVPEDEDYSLSSARPRPPAQLDGLGGTTWTAVSADLPFVERLLELYFQWSHPFYVIFSRECFYRDFRSGRHKYCSPLLVNAILAYGCHYTDDPLARTDPDNFRTAGDHFFAEARRLLHEDEGPSLTTTQALCVMAMREPSAGRDSSGFMYIGRCMRMAVELGLHLNTAPGPPMNLTASEIEVRKVTFWGCFVVDAVWSLCIGRICQLPRAAITLDKPILVESTAEQHGAHQMAPAAMTSRVFLQEFSTLAELINDNNHMFYAPKERITSQRLLDVYARYKTWYRHLPPPLRLPEQSLRPIPHIVVLHMLYHTVIVHLFRPFLKVEFLNSDIKPKDICIQSANKVTELLRLYRRHYQLRACQLILTHILLSVSVVHLIYSTISQTSSDNLVESLQGLEDLSICHYFGARSFKIVHALAQTWNLPWPEALRLSELVPKDNVDAELTSPPTDGMFKVRSTPLAAAQEAATNKFDAFSSSALSNRRESLSMFAHENGHVPPQDAPPTSAMSQNLQRQSSGPNQYATNIHSMLPTSSIATPLEDANALFWSMPGVGAPILPREYQISPMDINTVLSVNEYDRFSRDGFKMVGNTWFTQGATSYATNATDMGTLGFATTGLDHTSVVGGYDGQSWWQDHASGSASGA